jgi:hypothetical protein
VGNLIDLTKKAAVVLEKKNLTNVKGQVKVVVDKSGSMDWLYENGTVQELIDRLLGIGMNMDLDKSIDVFAFHDSTKDVGQVKEGNYQGFVNNVLVKKFPSWGGTKYAPAMSAVIDSSSAKKSGFFRKAKVATEPTFVIFVTDGNNSGPDQIVTRKLIKESSNQAIFWQFVGIGNERFSFLQELDDMGGRFLDNADFFKISDLSKISDEELYDKLLTEFPGWIEQAKAKGILA